MFPLDSDKVGAFWLDLVGNWGFWGEFLMEGGGMGRWRRCLIEGDAVFEAAAGELRVVAADGVLIRRSGFYMLSWSRPRLVAQDPAVGNGCWGEDWSWVGSQVPLPPEVQALRDWIRESNLYLQSLPSWIFHFLYAWFLVVDLNMLVLWAARRWGFESLQWLVKEYFCFGWLYSSLWIYCLLCSRWYPMPRLYFGFSLVLYTGNTD